MKDYPAVVKDAFLAGEKFTTNRLSSGEPAVSLIFLLNVMVDQNADRWQSGPAISLMILPTSLTVNDRDISGILPAADRSSKNHSQISALYIEDNIEPVPGTNIIPGLRFDYLSDLAGTSAPSESFAVNWAIISKSKQGLPEPLKPQTCINPVKANLPYSKGNGCPKRYYQAGATRIGNKDLDPEISVTKKLDWSSTGVSLSRKCDLLPQ